MRILFLSRYQNTIQRGAEVFVSELSQRLKKNHTVDVLSGGDADSLRRIFLGNYDVVVSINGGFQSFKASVGRLIKNYKLVITGQGGIGRGEIWNMVVAQPDVYVALTDYMAKWAKKWAFRTKVVKIPNGVDLSKFKPEGEKLDFNLERPIILSVGALVWYKHHEKVIEAVLRTEGSLLIAGIGPEKQKLENLGKNLLGKRFQIASFKYEDMPKVYRGADLFTLPSWSREAFGIAYVEAMACGLGVVAPDDLARSEIIGEAGILVDVSDSTKYAEAMTYALGQNWKDIAVKQAKQFSWDKIGKLYEQVFKEMLKLN